MFLPVPPPDGGWFSGGGEPPRSSAEWKQTRKVSRRHESAPAALALQLGRGVGAEGPLHQPLGRPDPRGSGSGGRGRSQVWIQEPGTGTGLSQILGGSTSQRGRVRRKRGRRGNIRENRLQRRVMKLFPQQRFTDVSGRS